MKMRESDGGGGGGEAGAEVGAARAGSEGVGLVAAGRRVGSGLSVTLAVAFDEDELGVVGEAEDPTEPEGWAEYSACTSSTPSAMLATANGPSTLPSVLWGPPLCPLRPCVPLGRVWGNPSPLARTAVGFRLTTTFARPANGRKRAGTLSHVFRPITTALMCPAGARFVTRAK